MEASKGPKSTFENNLTRLQNSAKNTTFASVYRVIATFDTIKCVLYLKTSGIFLRYLAIIVESWSVYFHIKRTMWLQKLEILQMVKNVSWWLTVYQRTHADFFVEIQPIKTNSFLSVSQDIIIHILLIYWARRISKIHIISKISCQQNYSSYIQHKLWKRLNAPTIRKTTTKDPHRKLVLNILYRWFVYQLSIKLNVSERVTISFLYGRSL